MPPVHYRPFHALIQRLASSRPGAWLVARTLHSVDTWLLKFSRGRVALTSVVAGVPVITVVTTGARTGKPRASPLLPIRDPRAPERFALIATNFGQHGFPAWYFNLRAHPRATCIVDGEESSYVAHEASGEQYELFWQRAVDIYPGYAAYKMRAGRRVPIMVMEKA